MAEGDEGIPWRRPLASLNYLLSSHVWRQDHNGFSHQDPGFIDHVVNKKAEIIVYLPPDANCLLSVADHCLRSRHYVNVIVPASSGARLPLPGGGDHPLHPRRRDLGVGLERRGGARRRPRLRGDVPTLETLAAAACCASICPTCASASSTSSISCASSRSRAPARPLDAQFDSIFTTGRPVIFAYHGYPWLIHRLTYRRRNHPNLHVRGYKEEGTTTTPFDMVMLNDLDRFHLVMDVIDRVPGLETSAGRLRQHMVDERLVARAWTRPRRGPSGRQRLDLALLVGRILVVNAGSTSLKLSLVAGDESSEAVGSLAQVGTDDLDAVAHRVVHGGSRFRDPTVVDGEVRDAIRRLEELAPLHNAPGRQGHRRRDGGAPRSPHVAVSDTAFHATIPAVAATYAVPEWREDWGSAATGSTASPCSGRPSAWASGVSSSAISAAAAR